MTQLYVADTNVLLDNLEVVQDYSIVILSHTLRELDKHKGNRDKPDLAFRARRATRYIEEHEDQFTFDLKDYKWEDDDNLEATYVDNMIITACLHNNYGLITRDTLLKFKARGFGITLVEVKDKGRSEAYTGVREITITDEKEFSDIYEDTTNSLNMLENEYLIVNFEGEQYCTRWDGEYHQDLALPSDKIVAPQNAHQACALDLLWNKDIPIKIIAGTYGSGKTFLSVKVALEFIDSKNPAKKYKKLMMIRNPIGSGEQIGFLKGTKEDKTSDFFKPLVQHIDGGNYALAQMETAGIIQREIPYYMKGLSIDDTFMLVDEAEDLSEKLIKLVGTRVGKNSCVVFSGDFKQAEDKYMYNNGLYIAIEKLKGNPLVGIVSLQEDVRSDASKVFAEM